MYANSPASVLASVPPQMGFSSQKRNTSDAAAPRSGAGKPKPMSRSAA